MRRKQCNSGFSMLEVLLAIIVIVVAGVGAYELFNSSLKNSNIADAEDQAVQIANVYTDLASSNLTSADNDVPTLLKNSGRLSNKYFSSSASADGKTTTVSMYNAFGALSFTSATQYSFVVEIPLGSINDTSSVPDQFFKQVQDVYSCTSAGGKSGCPAAVACTQGASLRCIKLYFNMNY